MSPDDPPAVTAGEAPAEEQAGALSLDLRIERDDFVLRVVEDLPLAGVTAVFGPSGSGKSTLLRAIAGFDKPSNGRIRCGDTLWLDTAAGIEVPAHRRPAGLMFQDARLFGHLSVAGNLDYAQRRAVRRARQADGGGRGGGDGSVMDRAAVIAALDLEPLLTRRVHGLSGGERKRVALGRTLLAAPRLLLLDEPLAGLDEARKADILRYLDTLQRRFHLPTLFVSHDVDEVVEVADRILVLAQGRVQLHGDAARVVEHLDLRPAGERLHSSVLVVGRVVDHDDRLHVTRVDVAGDLLNLPRLQRVDTGEAVRLRIRARDVALALARPEGLSIRNVLPGTVSELNEDGPGFVDVRVDLRGCHVRARVTRAAVEDLGLVRGMAVHALIKSVSFEQRS